MTTSPVSSDAASQPSIDVAAGRVRRAADGWHAVLRIGAVDHRVWSREAPAVATHYVATLSFDGDFAARAYAARRLWRAMSGRAPNPAFHELSKQRRERLSAALRALDARGDGGTYRSIAEALFGSKRIPDRAWKTHDLRNRSPSGANRPRNGARRLSPNSAARAQGQIAQPRLGYRKSSFSNFGSHSEIALPLGLLGRYSAST
ncbi:DUF2285 domain-containing protein [Bradyrhizobium sp. USDA 4504]